MAGRRSLQALRSMLADNPSPPDCPFQLAADGLSIQFEPSVSLPPPEKPSPSRTPPSPPFASSALAHQVPFPARLQCQTPTTRTIWIPRWVRTAD
eukprot:3885521-Pyramimonas_sp.AAC.2